MTKMTDALTRMSDAVMGDADTSEYKDRKGKTWERVEGSGINATWRPKGGTARSDFYGSLSELKVWLGDKAE